MHDKVAALLTPSQKSLVEDARDEARFLGPGQPPPMMPGGRFAGRGRGGPNSFGGPPDGMRGDGMRGDGMRGDGMRGGPPPDGGPGGEMPGGPPPEAF